MNFILSQYDHLLHGDAQRSFTTIKRLMMEVHDLCVWVGLEYNNKIVNSFGDNQMYALRDAISSRMQSVYFHNEILDAIHHKDRMITSDPSPLIGTLLSSQQSSLFDSIIFHSVSLYDYTSCFLSYIIFKQSKAQWSSLANKARSNIEFKSTMIARTIDDLDRGVISRLISYRGDLIHYKDDYSPVSQSFNLSANQGTIDVRCPSNFSSRFKKELGDRKTQQINAIANWLIENLFLGNIMLLKNVREYIEANRLIPPGKEFMTFDKPKD